jgi:hypothetical protein
MDPDVALKNARRAVENMDTELDYVDSGAAVELMEAFTALDEWLSKGGFLPRVWARRSIQLNESDERVQVKNLFEVPFIAGRGSGKSTLGMRLTQKKMLEDGGFAVFVDTEAKPEFDLCACGKPMKKCEAEPHCDACGVTSPDLKGEDTVEYRALFDMVLCSKCTKVMLERPALGKAEVRCPDCGGMCTSLRRNVCANPDCTTCDVCEGEDCDGCADPECGIPE